uniref:Fibroblast growth factor receptor n=1 Tax=Halocynthia roretzi TaxID=7729 RepID=Q9GSH3_HALRO|nr:FGF receptor [Halocynthia roretzi]
MKEFEVKVASTAFVLVLFSLTINQILASETSTKFRSPVPAPTVPDVTQFRTKSATANKTLMVKRGETIRINCRVRGYPKPNVLFYRGKKLLKNPTPDDTDPTIMRVRVLGTTLRIFPAYLEDSGLYTCIAHNANEKNSSLSYHVEVLDDDSIKDWNHLPNEGNEENVVSAPKQDGASGGQKPYWTKREKMMKRLHAEPAGNTVRFRCAVDGNPKPQVLWYKNDLIVQKNDRVGGYKYRNQVLILESVVLSDKGNYMCVARNEYGSINHTYQLDVQERSASRPILKFGLPANKSVYVGQDVEFKCEVFSDPHPHVKWLRHIEINGSRVDPKTNRDYVQIIKQSGVNETAVQTLRLKNVTESDSGQYTCLAENYIGNENNSAWLVVQKVPPPTTDTITKGIPNETNIIIYVMCGVLVILFGLAVVLVLYYHCYNGKDPPMLVRIENPDNIPPMTKIEHPTMLFGNTQAWQRMCMPMQEPFEFNIQLDLQWELQREDITLVERLDEGFFGQVFKADLVTCNNTRKEKMVCAVKMLKGNRNEKDVLDLLTEMDQMKRVGKHKNIINLLGVCTQNGPLWLVIEYAAQGNLRDYLRRNRPQNTLCNLVLPSEGRNPDDELPVPHGDTLTQKDIVSFAFQVARGLEFLAQKKCIHRDLAARNVLVTEELVMKIADFGLARDIRSCDYYRKHTRGHLPYKWMALEAMSDNIFTHATDVWSFGVLLWEIFSLAGSPYPGIKTHELVKFLRSGERLDKPQYASQEMYRLMRDCWEEDPSKRPNFRTLVEDLDRMLAESSTEVYIDFAAGCEAEYSESSEDESESQNSDEEDDDSVFERMRQIDSLSNGNIPFNEEADSSNSDPYVAPLLQNEENVLQNEHARLRSEA